MRRRIILIAAILIIVAPALWFVVGRTRVDGRSAAGWLEFARQGNRTVAYHAEGQTRIDGRHARFILDQGSDGRYSMQILGPGQERCTLGYDGRQLWYTTGGNSGKRADSSEGPLPPINAGGRILGTGAIAGRPVVRLAVKSGDSHKTIAIDRQTGVILAMTTAFRKQVVSEMTVEQVAFRPVQVMSCGGQKAAAIENASSGQLTKMLGGKLLHPAWLPAGFTPTGTFTSSCNCCKREVAVLRYSDGMRTLSLFEMRSQMMCAMGQECQMAPTGNALVASRRVGNLSVTAVGNLDAPTLKRILDHLQ
ncbi:MAG: MucB/RseB C-terminal domain-containing protein [Armatimonadota bacterium]